MEVGKGVGGGGGWGRRRDGEEADTESFQFERRACCFCRSRAGLMNFSHPGENHCEEVFNCFSSQAHQITALLSAGYKLMGIL